MSTAQTSTVRLHCVRIHDTKDDFKLKADFDNEIKFTFSEGKSLRSKDNFIPFIYTLDLNLKIDNSKQLYAVHKDCFKPIGKYHLVISRPRPIVIVPKIQHHENSIQGHKLPDSLENPYYFLFDIHFSKATMMGPPGIDTSYFDDLCLFTYYLLRNESYYIFDILANQFHANLYSDNRIFDKNHYNDFFKTCNLYMDSISTNLETNLMTLKIILRMIGLLPIEKDSFDRYNEHANAFATKILGHVRKQLHGLLKQLNQEEQLLFRSGLAILLCIELLYSEPDNSDNNKLIFLYQLSEEKYRQDIANEILAELYKLNQPIHANANWTDLFTIVNSNMIKLQDSYLIDSYETYIMFITKVSALFENNEHFYNKITKEFERLMYHDHLQVDIESILFLIKFTQHQLSYNHDATKRLLTEIRRIVETDEPLKYKIRSYFNSLEVTVENIGNVGYILGLKPKCTILNYIQKHTFLLRSLTKANSHDYYIKWFACFLAKGQTQDDDNHEQCKELLKTWTSCFQNDYSKFIKVLMTIDELLHAFEESPHNYWLRSYFIDHIIHLCFQQKDIFRIIVDGLLKIQNENFRLQFKNIFDNKYLSQEGQNLFKKLSNDTNLFTKLIELDQRECSQRILVRDLIQVICDKVEVTKDDLMRDTFNEPTKFTSTYAILSTNSLRTLPLYKKVVEQLILFWEEWEKDGFQATETKTWDKLKKEQRQVACDIWNLVGGNAGKTMRFEQLIDQTKRKIRLILTIKENITSCINNYCQEACDKEFYYNLLKKMESQLNQKKVLSIEVPKELNNFKLFTDCLNPVFSLHAWQKFLKNNKEFKKLKDNAVSNQQPATCLMILKHARDILDQFTERIKALYYDTKQPLLPQLKDLFPETNLIDHQWNILKSLLDDKIISYLEVLIEYWKNHEQINRISNDFMHLMTQYSDPLTEKVSVLQNILAIDDQTSIEACSKAYQTYCTNYSKKYSEEMLKLIAQWSSSKELLEFLYSLTETDVDDLLEVVNDWDETLINTKTVLDFVLLRRFLHQVDIMIKSICTEKPLELNDITACFEKVCDEVEFKNILTNFESCSKCLFSIKRICMGSTNKEQSKRRRILDIMKNSHFYLAIHQLKETVNGGEDQFDIEIINNNWETMFFDDLNELRDRAHLIQHASNNNSRLQNYTDDYIQQLGSFISFVETIEVVLKNLNSLYTAGYPVVKQYLMSKRKFTCNEGNYDELNKFKSSLEVQLADWEKQLCIMYEKCIDLTYFSYQQVWLVENSLYNQTATAADDPAYHLFKFIGIDPQNIRAELLPIRCEELNNGLQNIVQILNTQRISRNFPLQEDDQTTKRVYLVETSNKGILRVIYSLFYFNKIPVVANQLFYCTMDTNWMEIRAFIYRCFYSQTLHQLVRPELLSIMVQDKFVQLLNQLIEQNPKQFFLLSLITTVSSAHSHIVNGLITHRIVKTIQDQDMLSEAELLKIIQQIIGDNCILVTSNIAGLGKSTYIRNESLRLDKKYIKFPISGDVNTDTLVERLCNKEIQLASSTIMIHIDIGLVENIEQLNEFLYCLVLFRCFRLRQASLHVSANIPIYIELDASSCLLNLKDDIVIFKYLKTKHFNAMNWNELDINNSSTIQFVANYLQAIENQTIISKDIKEETITTLDKPTCIRLLQNHFLPKKNTEFVSWTQLSIFIAIYYKLFLGFSQCGHFSVDPDNHSSLRLDILNTLLNGSDQFTSLSVETVRKNQRSIYGKENVPPFSEAIIRWDKLQPFTLIFTATYEPLFVYKTKKDIPSSLIDEFRLYYQLINTRPVDKNVTQGIFFSFFNKLLLTNNAAQFISPTKNPEEQLHEFLIDHNTMTHEQFFLRLTSLSMKYLTKKSICVKCFKQYEYTEEHCTSCPTNDVLIRPRSLEISQDIEDFQSQVAMKLHSEYVLTADNYIKMLLIYLRVQSNLPVLIMGETGCGKTALIQFLCQKVLEDDMVVFHIHAGVTSEKIIETMRELMKKAHECLKKDQNKRIWVFLDEFNTTPNIGLLKEIVCERTLLGEELPKNIVLLGACNPQRLKKREEEYDDDIGIKKHHSKSLNQISSVDHSLLYSVIPIPETMLEHVWDYGYLDEFTETCYIKAILNACDQLTTDHNWFNCIVNLIVESQKFFREREDVSSVSLRDVARFCRFYSWFYTSAHSYQNREAFVSNTINDIERASLLALFLCYYFRLNLSTKREEYMNIIEKSIRNFKSDMSLDALNIFLQNEKNALIERMELPVGTAKNRSLTDNIFVLFTCILNRVPVILCGKPGSSKTLAVQIVISNLKGKKSKDAFFQTLPELIAVSYQGSQNCTSESIVKVFSRANKYLEAKSDIQLLPVIVFDEIGLAELSPHNPLKVLHSKLEIETCRQGFVGLSNWRLDASKMNRVLYLSCPDPNLDDLKMTATTLSKSMLSDGIQTIPFDDSIIEGLAVAYLETYEYSRQRRNQYYFGLRDYYSLIKGIVRDILQKESEKRDLYEIIRKQLSINFDGIINGSKFIWSKFCEHIKQHDLVDYYSSPIFDELITNSLSSRTGRFLMLIADSESAFDYIQRYIIIKYPSIQTRTLIGSTFIKDFFSNTTYTEKYNTRVLMDIILYAEKDIVLFLRGLGHLYDNLYDLFNQNFAVSAKKKYCRIALGSLYHPRCVIHDNFYCVVFVKQQDLDKYDPPFLNRFEKHIIDMNTIIHDHHKVVMSKLVKWIDELLSMKPNENFPCSKHVFIESSKDYILNLVTDAFDQIQLSDNYDEDQQETNIQNVIKYCQYQMIRTSSFDFPLLLSLKSQTNHTNHLIQQYYEIHTNLSFPSFINQILEKEDIPKLLIYTYTQIDHKIDYSGIKNHNNWVKETKLSDFETELDLIQEIKMHYQTGYSRLLCIRIDYHQEHDYIPIIKHILLNEQVVDESRGICLIFHLQRNRFHQDNDDVFFNGWSSVMIDDLQEHLLIPQNVLFNPSYRDLVVYMDFLTMETIFDDLINRCILKFRYQVSNKQFEAKINERRDRIIQQLISQTAKNDESLRLIIKKHLSEMIINDSNNSNQTQFKDWRQDLLTNEIIIGSCRSFNDALTKTVLFFVDNYLSLLLAQIEKHSFIDSYLFLVTTDKKTYKKLHPIWLECWKIVCNTIDISMIDQTNIEISLCFDLHLPCATYEYEIIRQIRETIGQDRQNKDEFAWKQLISKSIYGQSINKILQDSDLFTHYYHDQLTLARNEINIHQLSSSFIQRLISKMSGNAKDQLIYLLINYEELFEIMRLFEIGVPLIGKEDYVFEILDRQFIVDNDHHGKMIRNNTDLYYLVLEGENFYQIPPRLSSNDRLEFKSHGDPFIETSLMNLIELLVSSTIINSINDIEQLITVYNLFIQGMYTLSCYDHYEITNLEKFHSCLHLASCISISFPIDKALYVFKEVYRYSDFSTLFNTLDQIDKFVSYLKKVIHQEQSIANNTIVHQTLLKFENELLRNWFIENNENYGDILKYINDHDPSLWKYSAKIFTIIDKSLELSSTIRTHNGHIPQTDEYERIYQYLSQLDDSSTKIEILMTTHIYIHLILDENYELRVHKNNIQQIITILRTEFDHFKKNLYKIENEQNNKLELISLIGWLRYYTQYYVYALKNDIKDKIIGEVDEILARGQSEFYSTVKLFIIKQLCQIYNIAFHDLCNILINRNILWPRPMITSSPVQRKLEARHNVILPTPLFECHNDFIRINNILSSSITIDQLRDLIRECSARQDLSYCFIIWFIHYYSRFYLDNRFVDDQFVRLIEHDVKEDLTTCFETIGYKLILSLCINFDDKSCFQLKPFMPEGDLHQCLIVLNMIALIISFKSFKSVSPLGFLLFDSNRQMPPNYTEHFKKFDSLVGVAISNDCALIQMINVRNQIEEQMKNKTINESNHFIVRCSSNCLWMFYFENSDLSNEQKQCPLCKKEISISQNEDLLVTNTSHIRMNFNEVLQFISEYVKQHQRKYDFSYYNCELAQEKDIVNQHNHLTQPITYHFIHLLTHSIFLFLNDLNFMPYFTKLNCNYFQKHIKNDYALLQKHLSNVDQCYIWLYKLINHMINENFLITGDLNGLEKVIQFEKLIEERLIIPHIDSVIGQIRQYKSVYADFVYGDNKNQILANFVDELIEDNEKYPLLNFFNITNIHSINIIDDFHSKLQLLPDFEKNYPLTRFLLKDLSDYENIQYLYPIIKFTNYFTQNFNHHIKRHDAIKTPISQYLKNDSDLKIIYEEFLDVWYKVNLKDVYFDDIKYKFQHSQTKHNSENKTTISMFLLNKSNDSENMLPVACLQTIAKLQNDIVDYFHSHIVNYAGENEKQQRRVIATQSIEKKHLFHFDGNKLRKLLIEKGLMINYTYGMSRDIIYDYEEIEQILKNEISCLPFIDIDNMRFFNYQFELYDENISLINEIRVRFQQKLFDDHQRTELKIVINHLDNDFILQLSDSLEYILTYLRTINNKTIIETTNIQTFIKEYIHSKTCLANKIVEHKTFSSIHLYYIIDLYELIEECIFDKILCNNIRNELCEKSFSIDERTFIIHQVVDMILNDNNIADCFKNLICWISMFKRLLVRLLTPKVNINFDSSLHDYVKRTDMWKGNITKDDIRTIEINKNICLKHTFIILNGLEEKQNEMMVNANQQSLLNIEQRVQNQNVMQRTTVTPRPTNSLQKGNDARRRNAFRK